MREQLTLGVSALAIGAAATAGSNSPPWDLANFESLVAFGDSYTDDSRLGYFGSHNGSAPPVGWVNPAVRTNYPNPLAPNPNAPQHPDQLTNLRTTNPPTAAAPGPNT